MVFCHVVGQDRILPWVKADINRQLFKLEEGKCTRKIWQEMRTRMKFDRKSEMLLCSAYRRLLTPAAEQSNNLARFSRSAASQDLI